MNIYKNFAAVLLTETENTFNIGTIAVLAVLVLVIGLVIYKMIKNKKEGKSTCSCGGTCSCCGMAGSCHDHRDGSVIEK